MDTNTTAPVIDPPVETPDDAAPAAAAPPPPWARSSYYIRTPRMILRLPFESDAEANTYMSSDPLNSPFGGVVGANKTVEERREAIRSRAGSTARGENAWVSCILTDFSGFEKVISEPETQQLKLEGGYLVGVSGFNEFALEDGVGDEKVLVTNIGAMIHHTFGRRGLALETLQAVIEYGFTELKCDLFDCETDSINLPFRGLMAGMGLGQFEKPGRVVDSEKEGLKGVTSVKFRFGKDDWEKAKGEMKARGKWYI